MDELHKRPSQSNRWETNHAASPMTPAHRMLDEAFILWRESLEAYENPLGFRTHLNSCIQALRNVTFAVQKQKNLIPGFDSWYGRWQNELKRDAVLRWLVAARNRIVKEGDLATTSKAYVTVYASYKGKEIGSITVNPMATTEQVARAILSRIDVPEEFRDTAVLAVERCWMTADLPNHELLDALIHAYKVLSSLVADGYNHVGGQTHQYEDIPAGKGRKSKHCAHQYLTEVGACMKATREHRTVWVKVKTAEVGRSEMVFTTLDREFLDTDSTYPRPRPESIPADLHKLPIRRKLEFYFSQAREIFLHDGYHVLFVLLFNSKGHHSIAHIDPKDSADKCILSNSIAAQVERQGADELIFLGEAWHQQVPLTIDRRNDAKKERSEILLGVAASRTEGCSCARAEIIRESDTVRLGDTEFSDRDVMNFMEPVFEVWRKNDHHTK